MKSIFVYGGCVSRDIFNTDYNHGELKLADYVARNSIVKLADKGIKLQIDDKKIPSAFQQRLLKTDSENLLFSRMDNTSFSCFFMDLMFIKYRIVEYKNTWLTYSSELKKSGLINSSCRMLSCHDDDYWDKFKSGSELLFRHIESAGYLDKVVINELYLASKDQNGKSFLDLKHIEIQNSFLEKAYSILKSFIKDNQFLKYNPNLFIGNSEHRWGADPMHYIDDFYHVSYKKLISFLNETKV